MHVSSRGELCLGRDDECVAGSNCHRHYENAHRIPHIVIPAGECVVPDGDPSANPVTVCVVGECSFYQVVGLLLALSCCIERGC